LEFRYRYVLIIWVERKGAMAREKVEEVTEGINMCTVVGYTMSSDP